jgi:exonuclease III
MKIISWNIRGLNGRSKQKLLRDLIFAEKPDVLLLQETKCSNEDLNKLLPYSWKQGEAVSIAAAGTAGGLAVLWNPTTVRLENFATTRWSITAEYRLIGSNQPGHITNVYGPANPREKQTFLRSLDYLPSLLKHKHWIIGGDYNLIRTLEEKKGGSRRLDQDTNDFNSLIDKLNLIDLEPTNGIFTWTNRRTGSHQIACKLDRFLISDSLMMEGLAMEASILNTHGSDHWPIQLWIEVPATPGRKPFRFEQFWLNHPDFEAKIQDWWEQAEVTKGSKMFRFQQKLKNLKQLIKTWNKDTFGNIFDSQRQLAEQMENIQHQIRTRGLTDDLKTQEATITQQLGTRKAQEEILWRQKSRVQWLKEGERNTKFFHRSVMQRRHSNRITHLTSDTGELLYDHEDMATTLTDYYKNLLTEPSLNRSEAIAKIMQHVPSLVTQEQNAALLRPITIEEVDQALRDTPKSKAPGPDGFTSDFFHHCWPMIRREVWEIIEDSRATGQVLQALNATFLTLIPKEGQAHHPKQFRPIALCNVIYKLLTKVIARRLKPILPTIISPEQSGYIEGRQILDSVILAHEVIHSLQKTKTPGMLLKLDLSKAFDKISWEYMKELLLAFGFEELWVTWILNLTSTAFFSILVNGVPSRPFTPSRGIRQGDPLSPFLFIIMVEGLSRSIHAAVGNGSLEGLSLHGISPPISHSQFVDDTLLMGSPTVKEANSILQILQTFSDASGLDCNKDKSLIFFFNTPPPVQRHISDLLGFQRSSLPSKYLGIPLIDNALRNSSWEHLLSSFSKKLSSWTLRTLNLPSRLILLRAVLQALPTYIFSVLTAPTFVQTTIKSLQRNFLWQGFNTGKKIALVSWDKICRPKAQGGLGLRDPSIMNKILSAKIWWRWLKNPRDLWARLWRKKYAPTVAEKNLIRWNGDTPGSLVWTTAKQNRHLITQHAFWEVRDGKTALFWKDSWQQWPTLDQEEWAGQISAPAMQAGLATVADYWRGETQGNTWRLWLMDRQSLHLSDQVDLGPYQTEMLKRKIAKLSGEDILRWGHRPSGTYSTSEAYHIKIQSSLEPAGRVWQKIWNLKHWPKITLFLWLVAHSSILTWDNLSKRGFVGPSVCILCGEAAETMNHLLTSCPYTAQIWDQMALIMRTSDYVRDNIADTIADWRDHPFHSPLLNRIWQLTPGFILWQVWKERNRRLFRNIFLPWQQCWTNCRRNILETLHLHPWTEQDLTGTPSEILILKHWLPLPPLPPAPTSPTLVPTPRPSSWSAPPIDFLKLNFDGASKGNPGAAGYGVVFRNHHGRILLISAGSLGHTTNNVAELWALVRGLQLAKDHNFNQLLVEGDSQILVNLLGQPPGWGVSAQHLARRSGRGRPAEHGAMCSARAHCSHHPRALNCIQSRWEGH